MRRKDLVSEKRNLRSLEFEGKCVSDIDLFSPNLQSLKGEKILLNAKIVSGLNLSSKRMSFFHKLQYKQKFPAKLKKSDYS